MPTTTEEKIWIEFQTIEDQTSRFSGWIHFLGYGAIHVDGQDSLKFVAAQLGHALPVKPTFEDLENLRAQWIEKTLINRLLQGFAP